MTEVYLTLTFAIVALQPRLRLDTMLVTVTSITKE